MIIDLVIKQIIAVDLYVKICLITLNVLQTFLEGHSSIKVRPESQNALNKAVHKICLK